VRFAADSCSAAATAGAATATGATVPLDCTTAPHVANRAVTAARVRGSSAAGFTAGGATLDRVSVAQAALRSSAFAAAAAVRLSKRSCRLLSAPDASDAPVAVGDGVVAAGVPAPAPLLVPPSRRRSNSAVNCDSKGSARATGDRGGSKCEWCAGVK
jgi:hypothetical protein